MVEQVDTADLKSADRKVMPVRFRLGAPNIMTKNLFLKNISESIWVYGTSRFYFLDPNQEGYEIFCKESMLTHYVLSWIDLSLIHI